MRSSLHPTPCWRRAKLAVWLSRAVFLGSGEKFRVQQLSSSSPTPYPTQGQCQLHQHFPCTWQLGGQDLFLVKAVWGPPLIPIKGVAIQESAENNAWDYQLLRCHSRQEALRTRFQDPCFLGRSEERSRVWKPHFLLRLFPH